MPTSDPNTLSLPQLYNLAATTGLVRRLLELARDEDLGPGGTPGDLTSLCTIPSTNLGVASINFRCPGYVSGLECISDILTLFAPDVRFEPFSRDGDRVSAATTVGTLRGPATQILAAERVTLNLLGRLSGIATLTARFVHAAGPNARAKVYDTRKTTPGLRVLEKYAVRCGGGSCHRMGLFDAVLIKDNHIASLPAGELAASIAHASAEARRCAPDMKFFMVEVDTLDQLQALLTLPSGTVDIVLLDNMNVQQLERAAAMRSQIAPMLQLEASGGVNLETIAGIASSGVDRVSIGALTHQAVSLDVGLDFKG